MKGYAKFLPIAAVGILNAQTWAGFSTYGDAGHDQIWAIDFRGSSRAVIGMSSTSYSISGLDEDFVLITPNWSKVIGNPDDKDDWIYKTSWLKSGDIVVTGVWCYDGGAGPGSCYPPLYGLIVGLNDLGNFKWGWSLDLSNQWGCSGNANRQTRILYGNPTSDGGFVVSGYLTYNYYDRYGNCVSYDQDGYIAKFDSAGNPLWLRIFDGGGDDIATSVFEDSNGNYVVLLPSFSEIGIIKFDPSGNVLWSKKYPRNIYGSSIMFSWGKPTSDGGFILSSQIGNSTDNDAMFIKFDSLGNVVCNIVISTPGHDYGIDAVEGSNAYWMVGQLGINSGDAFMAKINKDNCSLYWVKYIPSTGTESARGIDIRDDGIPFIVGNTNNTSWSLGGYDGFIGADSGGPDTCNWRTFASVDTYRVSLTQSGNYTVYAPSMSISSYIVNVQDVAIPQNVSCGLQPFNIGDGDELYVNEKSSEHSPVSVVKGGLRVSKGYKVKIYDIRGRKVYEGGGGFIKLRRGVYFVDVLLGGSSMKPRKVIIP